MKVSILFISIMSKKCHHKVHNLKIVNKILVQNVPLNGAPRAPLTTVLRIC